MRIKNLYKKLIAFLIPGKRDIKLIIIIGAVFTFCIYLGFYQRHFFSFRYVLTSAFLGTMAAVLITNLLQKKTRIVYSSLNNSIRFFSIFISFLFSIILLVNVDIPVMYSLLPKSELKIEIPINSQSEGGNPIRLLGIETRLGYVHFSKLQIKGISEEEGKNLVFPEGQNIVIEWVGPIGPELDIGFRKPDASQQIKIGLDDQIHTFFLEDNKSRNLVIESQYDGSLNVIVQIRPKIEFIYYLPFILSFLISSGICVFSLLIVLSTIYSEDKNENVFKKYWVLYAIPPLIAWLGMLFVFWPGFITSDSLGQWEQMLTGNFTNWQSVIYSLLILFLTGIWNSPAIVAIVQIIALAAVLTYGLKIYAENGVSPVLVWGLSFLFAVFPVNLMFVSTIWKDIGYAISFLWLSILCLKIILNGTKWPERWGQIVALSISCVFISLFRKNGLAVSVGVFIVLLTALKKNRKKVFISAVVYVLVYLLITGPVYSGFDVPQTKLRQSNLIYLHHIAAHVDAGTELTTAEKDYIDSFLPIEKWNYLCNYVGTISYDSDFQRVDFLQSGRKNFSLAFSLFLREPLIDIKHMFCASDLVWRVPSTYVKSGHSFFSWTSENSGWVETNDFGITEDSFIPRFISPIKSWLREFGFADDYLVWYLRPAFYSYLTLFSISILFIKVKEWRIWIVGIPVISQYLIMFLVSFAPAYRYHYGTCLAGLFLIGLPFLSKKSFLDTCE